MTIRRKLRLSLTVAGLVALALLASLTWTQSRIEQLGRAAVLANELVLTVFELDRLTYEVVYSGAERRARVQWQLEHQTLERQLEDMLATGAESPAVGRLAAAQLKLEDLFSRIATETVAGAAAPDLANERREILFHQLVLFSRVMVNEAAALHRESLERQAVLRLWQNGVLLGALLLLGAVLLGGFGLILNSVGRPIEALRRGAERVSEGDLDHRVAIANRDEIGELARAFNHMTARLAASYADLQAEVAVRTRAEAALREAGQELEARVAARTAELSQEIERRRGLEEELQQRNRDLAAANHAKDEFLAVVSHELRTPLTALLGWVRLLRTGTPDTAKLERGLDVIERNTRAQASLIDDLLDVSRIVSGKMVLDLQTLDLLPVVEAALDAVRPAAAAKPVELHCAVGPGDKTVRGDPNRLQQVVYNLLSNAIKFTPAGGHVELRLERAGRHVVITVSDTGVGMAREFLPHVFERFRQAGDSSTRQHQGLGLGLAIVRHLVELHGGGVAADSPGEGQGAAFTVRLPVTALRPADEEPEAPGGRAHRRLAGVRVLVVEDDPDSRELLLLALAQQGAVTAAAASVPEALERFREHRPDLLLSDIGLPGEDGYALIRRLRALPAAEGGDVPAVALTAFAKQEDRRRALEAGFQEHVAKPVEPELLVGVLAVLVARRPGAHAPS